MKKIFLLLFLVAIITISFNDTHAQEPIYVSVDVPPEMEQTSHEIGDFGIAEKAGDYIYVYQTQLVGDLEDFYNEGIIPFTWHVNIYDLDLNFVSTINSYIGVSGFSVYDNHLYMSHYPDSTIGIQIYNVEVASQPEHVTNFIYGANDSPDFMPARDVLVTDGFAYVASLGEGIQIVDISDLPEHSYHSKVREGQGFEYALAESSNRIFASRGFGGITVLTKSTNPASWERSVQFDESTIKLVYTNSLYALTDEGNLYRLDESSWDMELLMSGLLDFSVSDNAIFGLAEDGSIYADIVQEDEYTYVDSTFLEFTPQPSCRYITSYDTNELLCTGNEGLSTISYTAPEISIVEVERNPLAVSFSTVEVSKPLSNFLILMMIVMGYGTLAVTHRSNSF